MAVSGAAGVSPATAGGTPASRMAGKMSAIPDKKMQAGSLRYSSSDVTHQ
jgi:hypothetical protein